MNRTVRARLGRAAATSVLLGAVLIGGVPATASGTACIDTGALDRDGTPLTARLVNPTRPVSGRVDASGCEVGVYFNRGKGLVAGAEIFGARYYGVLADGNGHDVSVVVRDSQLHDIGEAPITSSRHGQGIAYRGFGGTATGTAVGNRIWRFQEAGLNATGPGSTASFVGNVITGRGATDVISQNGIQVIHGAHGLARDNVISNLRFTGPNVGNGILVVGGPGYGFPYTRDTRIEHNRVTNADVGINIFEIEEDGSPSPLPTNVLVVRNIVRNDALTNHLGWSDDLGFQAGISDYANHDRIVGNVVSGAGYDPDTCGSSAICSPIFTDGSIDPIVSGNILQ
jgi:hypothetical protein